MEFIVEEILKTIISLGTTVVMGWIFWLVFLWYRSYVIRALLKNPSRLFVLYYRGEEDTSHKKLLQFNLDGTINDGKHANECYWEVKWGLLKIFTNARKIYSKFKWSKDAGRLVHINDPRLPSVMGQYIVPLFIPAGQNRDIYLQNAGLEEGDR